MANDPVLIFADRDGTINIDRDYYLGSAAHWKDQIEILPGVVEGIKKLNAIPNAKFIVVTAQSGVALGGEEFLDLTPERLEEVNSEIVRQLGERGAVVDACFSCGYVTSAYAEKEKAKGRVVLPEWVNDNASCIKPKTGMMEAAAKKFGTDLSSVKHKFMIGDTFNDVQMGMNGGCKLSILIPSFKTRNPEELEKVEAVRKNNPSVLVVKSFLEAAETTVESLKSVDAA